jgi:hypothetical protein
MLDEGSFLYYITFVFRVDPELWKENIMLLFDKILIVYLLGMSVLGLICIICDDLGKDPKLRRDMVGISVFLVVWDLLPLVLLLEQLLPGLIGELQPYIFRPGRFTNLNGRRTDA